jgi:hypothetical protein
MWHDEFMAQNQINIPEGIAARYTNPDQFERFDAAVRHVLSIPRAEILRREAEYKRQAALNPNRRGPKKKPASPAPGVQIPA